MAISTVDAMRVEYVNNNKNISKGIIRVPQCHNPGASTAAPYASAQTL
jgi:hypothetical protein